MHYNTILRQREQHEKHHTENSTKLKKTSSCIICYPVSEEGLEDNFINFWIYFCKQRYQAISYTQYTVEAFKLLHEKPDKPDYNFLLCSIIFPEIKDQD